MVIYNFTTITHTKQNRIHLWNSKKRKNKQKKHPNKKGKHTEKIEEMSLEFLDVSLLIKKLITKKCSLETTIHNLLNKWTNKT